jgi:glycosyl transferase family 11
VIVVQLSGGLGNQMLQYAAGRALAARRGTPLVLDSSWFEGRGGSVSGEVRRYELGCFVHSAPLARVDEVARLPRGWAARLRAVLDRRLPLLEEIEEPPFGQPAPAVVDAPDNTYLRGYWQNRLYFADAEDVLRADFAFRPEIAAWTADLVETIGRSGAPVVSVHVRRSDYVSDAGVRDRMGVLEPDYFRRALETVAARVGEVRPLVFTDDVEWCRAELRLAAPDDVVGATRDEGDTWASLMHAMSRCAHHVLANSSFSWWGAWLNPSPDKVVVAPTPWLQDQRWDDSNRIPPEWIRIDRDAHQADQPPSTTRFEPVT